MRREILFAIMVVLLLDISLVLAHEHNLVETKQIIDSGISCDKLSDEQLEAIGEYYMEQIHPGEAHELMDQMMGGEGSDSLKQMHIQMAKRLYCNEDVGGMMNMMMGGNMMGSGGMGMMGTNMMQGKMGDWGFGFSYLDFINVLYVLLLIGLIILVYLWIIKLWKNMQNKRRGKR